VLIGCGSTHTLNGPFHSERVEDNVDNVRSVDIVGKANGKSIEVLRDRRLAIAIAGDDVISPPVDRGSDIDIIYEENSKGSIVALSSEENESIVEFVLFLMMF